MKKVFLIIGTCSIMVITALITGWYFWGPVGGNAGTVPFIVPQHATDIDVPHALYAQHFVRNESAFRWLYGVMVAGNTTGAGGYRLSGSMNALDIVHKLTAAPDLVWVVVREGLRKEQIESLLREKLGWPRSYTLTGDEGTFFPDTYLLPKDEAAEQISQRFTNRFNEKIAPYTIHFLEKNIKWSAGITIASLIQREAGGSADMSIISGIIWNRLDKKMPLQIDATIQYVIGNANRGWWPVIKGSDTSVDSPYNTYLYSGLPPTPIANPGLRAIAAAADPGKTDCLFYLHDHFKQIHCAVTYTEHLENIKKYLN